MITEYFFPLGTSLTDGWLVHREREDYWVAILCERNLRAQIGGFASAQDAALALANGSTGTQHDAMLLLAPYPTRKAMKNLLNWEPREEQ